MAATSIVLAVATILLWSFLACIGSLLTHVPPFLLVGVALTVAGLVSSVTFRTWFVPWKTFAVGVSGIFGYHFLVFTALQLAPPVEANLINYLWPLLIVLLSPLFLTGYNLRLHHWAGSMLGLLGAGLIVTGGKLNFDLSSWPGYLCAAGAALIWSCYSLMTKRLPAFPTTSIGGFCLVSGLLALGIHFLYAGSMEACLSLTVRDWLLLFALGIGPMGAAFFTWDAALKRGDPRIIGALTYITPLLSTLNLVLFGNGRLTWVSGLAMVVIISGACIGSLDIFLKRGGKTAA